GRRDQVPAAGRLRGAEARHDAERGRAAPLRLGQRAGLCPSAGGVVRSRAAARRHQQDRPQGAGRARGGFVQTGRPTGLTEEPMKLNALFPTRDIGTDPTKIRDWSQAAEDLGFDGIEVADHVFGAAPRGDWKPTYSEHDPFHETFTTMAYIAAVTKKVELASGVLILPQRQAGVVAKQAAEVDILSGGRLRLGVGVGWNHVEYEALGTEWKTRGARQAEQIEVMRLLWTKDLVTFHGRFHTLNDV